MGQPTQNSSWYFEDNDLGYWIEKRLLFSGFLQQVEGLETCFFHLLYNSKMSEKKAPVPLNIGNFSRADYFHD